MRDKAGAAQRPVTKERLAVNIFFRHESPVARVARSVAVVAHHEIEMRLDRHRRMIGAREIALRVKIRLFQQLLAPLRPDIDASIAYLDCLAGQPDDALDVALCW